MFLCYPRAPHGTVIHAAVAGKTWVLRWAIPFAASTRITGVTTLMRGSEAVQSWPASGGPTLDAASEALKFEAELRPLIHSALRLAAAMLLDQAAAEDAVQEAALRAWLRRGNRRPNTELRPWFLAIVANQCREIRRGPWWRLVLLQADPLEMPSAAAPATEDVMDIRAALRRLSTKDRLALVLRYYLDLPFEEVASIAGCSLGAAKSRARRGEASMRSRLATTETRP